MRTFFGIVAGLAIAASCHAAPAKPAKLTSRAAPAARTQPPPPLPIFEFMGQNTENPTTMTELFGRQCIRGSQVGSLGTDGYFCNAWDWGKVIIGGVPLSSLNIEYYKSKLREVRGTTEPSFRYLDLKNVFTLKYGQPQKVEVRKWQNRMGATLDNEVSVWAFKGGNLELEAIGSSINDVSFRFTSLENSPQPPAVEIDF